jgi:hypothetical protein
VDRILFGSSGKVEFLLRRTQIMLFSFMNCKHSACFSGAPSQSPW